MKIAIRNKQVNTIKDISKEWERGCIPNHEKIDKMIDRLLELKNTITDNEIKKCNEKFWEDFWKRCKQSSKEKIVRKSKISGYIYIIKCKNFYKIGRTKSFKNRLNDYNDAYPFKIKVIRQIQVDDYVKVETTLLRKFRHKRVKGEWFKFSNDDLVQLNKEVDKYAKNNK